MLEIKKMSTILGTTYNVNYKYNIDFKSNISMKYEKHIYTHIYIFIDRIVNCELSGTKKYRIIESISGNQN